MKGFWTDFKGVHGPRQFSRINRIASSALEKRKLEKQVEGEILKHPGCLGCQDTYYVDTIKGVGRIYQQTFIDSYSKVAMTKLYDRKNALVDADMLNDKVIPWLEEEGLWLLRILTDRGTKVLWK
nr:hypothetical protein [Leptospira mayottensis]